MKTLQNILSKRPLITLGTTLVIGLVIGWLAFRGTNNHETTAEHVHTPGTIWTCSMHPQIRQDGPGSCPICGMNLIPLEQEKSEAIDVNAVMLSASAKKIAEIETSVVQKGVPIKKVSLSGMVKPDERRIHELTAHFPGRIEQLFVNFTGQKVRKGQVLATIFSPELVTAQKELFEAIKYKTTNPQFYEAARNKLKLWQFTNEQIDTIEQSGEVQFYFKILSPGTGTVTKRNVAQGDHAMVGMSMFQIIDLSHVWVEFDAYESDNPWVKVGSKVTISINSLPGKVFPSKVTFIDPVLDENKRTTVVRAELDNKEGRLRPGMFANGEIKSLLNTNTLLIPKTAVLWTGKRSVVYVQEKVDDRFVYHFTEIELGEDTGSHYVVVNGLKEGQSVVTNGAFKVDASAQLQGKPSMMNPEGEESKNPHEGMKM